ncbi:MAG: M6 family metalloprotease domain-containing protein [Candidatus Coatesbacteria bacterium]|nr:M6 family metalloprotease domain-containing protein [Candidatus Coatesbacteria bacterium]
MGKKMTLRAAHLGIALLIACACVPLSAAPFSAYPLTDEQVKSLRVRGELENALAARDAFLNRTRGQASAASTERLSLGDRRALVILVDFEDNPAQYDVQHFESMLFSENEYPTGSFRDYYRENSCGQLDVDGDVVGWYRMPHDYAYYADNYYGFGTYPRNAQRLVEDAVNAADTDVDFAEYDNNLDGMADMLIVVHSGQEGAGDPSKIWSHVSGTSGFLPCDGVYVYEYAMCPELSPIGVYCHEFGHLLGLPDLYDTDYSSTGLGAWSLMAAGCNTDYGRTPAHFDAWCKVKLRWIEPIVVEEKLPGASAPAVENEAVVYRLWTDGTTEKQYFLIENRQKVGFDQYLPGDGLLIYHIDDSVQSNRDENHYKVAVEQADGRRDLEYGRAADRGDPFPGFADNRRFNSFSNPNSLDYLGEKTHVEVNGISDSGLEMTANLAVVETSPDFLLSAVDVNDENDGMFSAGEQLFLRFCVENRGFNAGLVSGVLRTDDQYVTVVSDVVSFPGIARDEKVWSEQESVLEIASDCPCPHGVNMHLDLSASDFATCVGFTFHVCSTFAEAFEQEDVFWRHYGLSGSDDEWHQSPNRNSTQDGMRSAKCGSKSRFDDYGRNLDNVLVSPIVGMKQGSLISFKYWLDAEIDADGYGVDVGLVEGTEDGQTWFMLVPDAGYPSIVSRAVEAPMPPGSPCFAGSTGAFVQATITCPAAVRLQQFRFRFLSNVSAGKEGWYIDDVAVASPASVSAPPVIMAAGFMRSQVLGPGETLRAVALPQAFGAGNAIDRVELVFEGNPLGVILSDDGEAGDDIAGDGIYSTLFPVPHGIPSGQYVLQIVATDSKGQQSTPWPQLNVGP